MASRRARLFTLCFALIVLFNLIWFHDKLLSWAVQRELFDVSLSLEPDRVHNVEVVVASLSHEDTRWLSIYLPEWKTNIYVADDPNAPLTVPINKGRESMVYLTYIIDHYDQLPNNIIFMHASRFAWHNDDPDYDAIPTLRNLRIPYLQETGYVNLRCVWVIGCPSEIRPVEDEVNKDDTHPMTKDIYKQAFEELLPELPMPAVVAVSCCSQFGVTREAIRHRPKEDYLRFRQWLLDTPLEDGRCGRVFEFAWHIIFGKEGVFCPSAGECYCKVFGICGLNCSDSSCDDRYILPTYSNLPAGWPRIGWSGEARNFTGPLA
ncbi:hypothetical protein JX265_003054 [Neoarthrinium moseri]|uniref:Uncharacterized protein n=1 Tax=Neoarthrinium moseri TaxID=1658444 RepID=A0A9Q0ATQ2_9PEZI|nr:hypothetical protein JX266_002113 [Neoarthrinium moseri]KAI1878877.1 hypothetical protein JX265_003054 [Neoarthrinium moseri]